MTRIVLTALAALALAVPAASAASVESASSKKTIAGLAGATPELSTLLSLVKKAGLADELSAPGALTVFAPTNAAFAELKASAPATYQAVSTNPALLRKVLTYHVLAKRVPSSTAIAAAKKRASVKTVQGEKIALSIRAGKLVLNGSSRVIVADVKASNGVIHAVDAVLVPPSAT